jgi:hypothetical protein
MDEGEKSEHYIDPRTERDPDSDNMNVVKPFCFFNGWYWYVCPDCQKIHYDHRTGKIETNCCTDIDCYRYQVINGEDYIIPRNPIILDDSRL